MAELNEFPIGSVQRTDMKAMASTTSHATITSEATAPAAILALSFSVVG